MKNKIHLILLAAILVIGIILRIYKLGTNPPSISWDEASVGYNAWTILNWGMDEWGNKLPLIFKSFEDFKHPIHIYLTLPFVAVFGLNDIGVRASSAFFGVLNIILIYLLAAKIFKNKWAGVIASGVLAISPYNIVFSRFNHEFNFAIFFFFLGTYLTLQGIEKKNILLSMGYLSFGIDIITYHSAKIIVPVFLLLFMTLYIKELLGVKKYFFAGILLFLVFAGLHYIEPQLLGTARLKQTSSVEDRKLNLVAERYKSHFNYKYLFEMGDINPKFSTQKVGIFYKPDFPFLIIGAAVALWQIVIKKKKEYFLILFWAAIAPIPASVSNESPHAARAMFMNGSWHLILTIGIWSFIEIFKKNYLKILVSVIVASIYAFYLSTYIRDYFADYQTRYAIEWQFGMREIVKYIQQNEKNYYAVYMTDIRSQPYIFYLFYQKYPLPEFLNTVKYNETIQRPSNIVTSFGKYSFGTWDPIESIPEKGILYVVGSSHYNGLRHKSLFQVKKAINYPNGTDAFYLVSGGGLNE